MSPALFANPKAHVQDSQACLLGHTRAQLPAQGHGHPSPPAGSPAKLGHSPRTMLSCRPPLPRAASRSRCRICHPFVTQQASPRTRRSIPAADSPRPPFVLCGHQASARCVSTHAAHGERAEWGRGGTVRATNPKALLLLLLFLPGSFQGAHSHAALLLPPSCRFCCPDLP